LKEESVSDAKLINPAFPEGLICKYQIFNNLPLGNLRLTVRKSACVTQFLS